MVGDDYVTKILISACKFGDNDNDDDEEEMITMIVMVD